MKKEEFDIENYLTVSSDVSIPDWLDTRNQKEMAIYEEVCRQASIIEALINCSDDLELKISMRKITAASVVRQIGLKNRSSFTAKRYEKLYKFMVEENHRLSRLWDIKSEKLSTQISRPNKADTEVRVAQLTEEVNVLKARLDLKFLDELLQSKGKFRFVDLKRTIEEQNKRIEELELQNSELQLRLKDILRPVR